MGEQALDPSSTIENAPPSNLLLHSGTEADASNFDS